MKQIVTHLTIILSLIFLLGCEKEQLSFPSTWSVFTPTEQELADLIVKIEKEFKSDEEHWNEKISYTSFTSQIIPGYADKRFAKIHFSPTYSTDKVRYFIAVDCEKDLKKQEEWQCEKTSARTIYYDLLDSWVSIAGDNLSDGEAIHFFEILSQTAEIPVFAGKNLITKNIEFFYLAEAEDGMLIAEILDKKNGASMVYFDSKKNEPPKISITTKLTYDCEDQNFKHVSSDFPCDYKQEL